jgi:Flp pilus assembly protein TadD
MTIKQAMQMASAHQAAGRLSEAEEVYRAVLAQMPDNAYALNHLGLIYLDRGQKPEGIRFLRESVHVDPTTAVFHTNLSGALLSSGDAHGAAEEAQLAIAVDPADIQAFVNLAQAHWLLSRVDDALAEMRKAIELQPDRADAHSHLGLYLQGLRRFDEALPLLQKAADLEPSNAYNFANVGGALYALRRLDEAKEAYHKALAILPNEASLHSDLALVLLVKGDWINGLREYEWRQLVPSIRSVRRSYPQPQWDGSPLAGRTIFLYSEQGLGDAVLFGRFAGVLAESGAKVVFECNPSQLDLFRSLAGVSQLIARGQTPPAFDVHSPLLSVPLLLGTTPQTVPARSSYLSADKSRKDHWHQIIGTQAGEAKLRVGLVWGGSKTAAHNPQRSISLERLAPLASVEGVRWFSLQVGPAQADLPRAPAGMDLVELGSSLRDFADTAAAMANLDLIISVDTSACHIAGSIGKDVWVFEPYLPYWVWLMEGQTTPWYTSMRLFRQPKLDDWDTVIKDIATALRQRVAES